ncbi:IS110 family transposase [soil metagenome]
MEELLSWCCGVDIHKRTVVACLVQVDEAGRTIRRVRTFGTMTGELVALADWLEAAGCQAVAMESTGSYWKPVYNLLEDRFTLLLVNAQHLKQVPGRKTDVKDCEWIAHLLQYGLLRASYVPERAQRELRELTRSRTALVRERSAEINRLAKVLEGANIKLGSVASEITGVSGRAMLQALVDGETDPEVLAELARGQLRRKLPQLVAALTGTFGPHQRFLVDRQLAHIAYLDESVAEVSAEIAARLAPFAEQLARLDSIPGVGSWTAEVLLAEIGTDMTRFPSAQQLASWAGMCPGNRESAGTRQSGRTRQGSPWLKTALVESAYAAGRSRQTALGERYRRLCQRRGRKRAGIAVGHTILVTAYHLLKNGEAYREPGPPDTQEQAREREHLERQLVRRLEALGNTVTITRCAA